MIINKIKKLVNRNLLALSSSYFPAFLSKRKTKPSGHLKKTIRPRCDPYTSRFLLPAAYLNWSYSLPKLLCRVFALYTRF